MKRRILAVAIVILCGGIAGLLSFFDQVKTVHAIGLSASGFSTGVGFTLLLFALVGPIKGNKEDPARSEAAKEQERQNSRVVKPKAKKGDGHIELTNEQRKGTGALN